MAEKYTFFQITIPSVIKRVERFPEPSENTRPKFQSREIKIDDKTLRDFKVLVDSLRKSKISAKKCGKSMHLCCCSMLLRICSLMKYIDKLKVIRLLIKDG